ncbi:SH3 domain-containing protein [Streptomyces silvisoli]|uniref:SH3 domain-containing protein n=1 Tax=Streptomyces silvisoli TaxID=3034235 RepID=UPI0028BD47F8|nr:SH3 domain-containing protein [Streptomyces silvisoli]
MPLNVRSDPGTAYWITGTIGNGTQVSVTCKIEGTIVGGNDWWYQLAGQGQGQGLAHCVNTYDYVPWCGD